MLNYKQLKAFGLILNYRTQYMSQKYKIIIIGKKSKQENLNDVVIEYYEWKELKQIKNISDYHTVIINLLSLKELKEEINGNIFFKIFNIFTMIDIVKHDGEIIIVGNPDFNIMHEKDSKPFLSWTGIDFVWEKSPGDTIIFDNPYPRDYDNYKNYISHFKKWSYSLTAHRIKREELMEYFSKEFFSRNNYKLNTQIEKFCYNRYKNGLAFIIRLGIFKEDGYGGPSLFGPIIFLPEINKNEDETIEIILNDICGIEYQMPEPEWAEEYIAPGQEAIDRKINETSSKINVLSKELKKDEAKKVDVRQCVKLLYEKDHELEPIVRDILSYLGANVEEPTEQNKEDGWVYITIREEEYSGVLEIKHTKSDTFGEEGRKQLLDWVDRGRTLRRVNHKGIFIGNSAISKPPQERPYAFNEGWERNAKLSRICAIKTEDLYVIYSLHKKNQLNVEKFWDTLFNTDGIFNIEPFLPQKNHEENKKDPQADDKAIKKE